MGSGVDGSLHEKPDVCVETQEAFGNSSRQCWEVRHDSKQVAMRERIHPRGEC